jgi:hypothetical protein
MPVRLSATLRFVRDPLRQLAAALFVAALGGCSAGPGPESAAPPPQQPPATTPGRPLIPPPNAETGFSRIVSGSGDSVGAIPGSATAQFAYRFRQIEPGSDRFTFQDRDLSFYFRPTPNALHFQVENRQNRPVWIDWDRSTWTGPSGSEKISHATTRWADRYGTLPPTQILGLQRYSDYMFPISLLVDPGSSDQQLHRVMFPEDQAAVQYVDREFGVNLAMRIEDRIISYPFRFKVASVVPR